MDLFLLKKIITVFIMPINIVLLLLIIAMIMYKRKPSFSIKSVSVAFVILLVSSFAPFSDSVMTTIENDYPAYKKSNIPIDYIVVLGCSHNTNAELPVTSQLSACSLQRVVEALRIYKLHPEARVITSGYGGFNPVSNAETVKQSLVILGVPAQKIITESFPMDTAEEAELIAPRVQGSKIVLITNADHMTRSMNYFEEQGVYPLAAPTGFWVKSPDSAKNWAYYFPNSLSLQQTTVAWYESLGQLVQWFKSIFK
ncbi:ElyC/SanA/YdcF family protein [Colwellia sp. E2M01]|uniref:ElyC/SanA/YdcF family protein n=1 Tax=Colwellia sp. E2M01 TaxID=2841561 RepID=UPI001C094A8C|nr:ElyC/SanA/YdcF family protein [Colwellia sp. E2M01]MBU2870841.1 YdcF family protein [Colwellia sp. E2M01]